MLDYVVAGLALGSVYAIAASGIIVTFVSSGVLNFAFGSLAFVLARFFYYLNTEQGWSPVPALLVSVFVAGPVLGAVLYEGLMKHLRRAAPLIRIVATIGLSVSLPALSNIVFGNGTINAAPGLATAPVRTFHVAGATVNLDQVITFGFVLAVVAVGYVVLQRTDAGLKIRALVDTEALTSLSGVNPARLSLAVWMATTALAGLAGVLAAPTAGLTTQGMTLLMASAFAAVVAARLRSLPVAVGVAIAMGVLTDGSQDFLPQNSSLSADLLESIPFLVMGGFLLFYTAVSEKVAAAASSLGGALDRAIRPAAGASGGSAVATKSRSGFSPYLAGPVVVTLVVAALPLLMHGYWLTLLGGGVAYAVIFLSFTVVTGEGGMLWLCQPTFAFTGALATAELLNHNVPWFPAVLIAGCIAVPVGLVVGFLTIRLGDLYVALVTLTFGLLAETLIFTRNTFSQEGAGVSILRPDSLSDDRTFTYVALLFFVVIALLLANVRRSTGGLAFGAVRGSEPAARMLGLNVLSVKLVVCSISSFVAAVGGGLLALDLQSTAPETFATFAGLVWLAVLVTVGSRSIVAALLAGLAFTLLPGVFQTYLSTSWGNVPTLLFGLGAVAVALQPQGQVARVGEQFASLAGRVGQRRREPLAGGGTAPSSEPAPAEPAPAATVVLPDVAEVAAVPRQPRRTPTPKVKR